MHHPKAVQISALTLSLPYKVWINHDNPSHRKVHIICCNFTLD
jgi:hypothetical protein